jgi:hypothetical protein
VEIFWDFFLTGKNPYFFQTVSFLWNYTLPSKVNLRNCMVERKKSKKVNRLGISFRLEYLLLLQDELNISAITPQAILLNSCPILKKSSQHSISFNTLFFLFGTDCAQLTKNLVFVFLN